MFLSLITLFINYNKKCKFIKKKRLISRLKDLSVIERYGKNKKLER